MMTPILQVVSDSVPAITIISLTLNGCFVVIGTGYHAFVIKPIVESVKALGKRMDEQQAFAIKTEKEIIKVNGSLEAHKMLKHNMEVIEDAITRGFEKAENKFSKERNC